jgi:hypothetical protein
MLNEIEELQKEKLRLEIKNIKKPSYRRFTFWTGSISLLLAVIGVIGQSILSNIKSERAMLDLVKIESAKDSMYKVKGKLMAEINQLQAIRKNIQSQNDRLIKKVTKNPSYNRDTSMQSAVKSVENAYYSIAIYAYNVYESQFDTAKLYITGQGYSLIDAQLLSYRPPWLATQSSILYYDNKSIETARMLAQELSVRTKLPFTFSRGSGFGIPKGQESVSIRIHLVR